MMLLPTIHTKNRVSNKKWNILYIRYSTTQRAQAARITGIINSSGKYIAFLDSDDELLPDSLKMRLEALKNIDFNLDLIYDDILIDTGEEGQDSHVNHNFAPPYDLFA